MPHSSTLSGMFLHFDPAKVVLPPILGGPQPHTSNSTTPPTEPTTRDAKSKDIHRMNAPLLPVRFQKFEEVFANATHNELNYTANPNLDGASTKERLRAFESKDEVIKALQDCFQESESVNFAATYRAHDPGVSHKHRIQQMTHEIWRATGYRFTVKDHPRTKDGHKTRLWCSQDVAHKAKPSKMSHTPRVLSDGVVVAKRRYPCRSGLLISSRDSDQLGTVIVVVRVHHHVAHESYYDHTIPPEMTQSVWTNATQPFINSNLTDPFTPPSNSLPSVEHDEASDLDMEKEGALVNPMVVDPIASSPIIQSSGVSSLTPEMFQARMRRHISDIRDFCDGLEYQLQFNDFQLLNALENQGAQFLKLVHHCLEMESRSKMNQNSNPSAFLEQNQLSPRVDMVPS